MKGTLLLQVVVILEAVPRNDMPVRYCFRCFARPISNTATVHHALIANTYSQQPRHDLSKQSRHDLAAWVMKLHSSCDRCLYKNKWVLCVCRTATVTNQLFSDEVQITCRGKLQSGPSTQHLRRERDKGEQMVRREIHYE